MWPECHIVHGKPRHSQSQGSVERANQDIENKLASWMKDNNTTKWSDGLRFIHFSKNRYKIIMHLLFSVILIGFLDAITPALDEALTKLYLEYLVETD